MIYIRLLCFHLTKIKKGRLTIYDYDNTVLFDAHRSNEYHGIIYTKDFGYFSKKIVSSGDIGLGEAYMTGNWTSPNISHLFMVFLLNNRYLQTPPKRSKVG